MTTRFQFAYTQLVDMVWNIQRHDITELEYRNSVKSMRDIVETLSCIQHGKPDGGERVTQQPKPPVLPGGDALQTMKSDMLQMD